MDAWVGIALALRAPQDDALHSRVPTYAHPLAGRNLGWHVLRRLAMSRPAPSRLLLATAHPVDPATLADIDVEVEIVEIGSDEGWSKLAATLDSAPRRLLLVDAAAPTLDLSLDALFAGPTERYIVGEDGEPLALWIDRDALERRLGTRSSDREALRLDSLTKGLDPLTAEPADRAFRVRDRAGIARATAIVRDRIVRNLMAEGVTFLLPETVLVDVQVRIGVDSVIYPGVVLEGETTIGAETVVGPHCRIIDGWIGSGVELKGWNYIAGARVRNRAVLEPYVRRGFD